MKFNLEIRTLKFAKSILNFCKEFRICILNENIIKQVLRSSQSVSANYKEANGASSPKDFEIKFIFARKNQERLDIG